MIKQAYHLSIHPDHNDNDFRNPKMLQIYLWDALLENGDTTYIPSDSRLFHGVIIPIEFLDLINENFFDYTIVDLSYENIFLYKVFQTHKEAWFDIFEGGYASIGMRNYEYTAEEFSPKMKKILNERILSDRNFLFALKWRRVKEEYLNVITECIKTNFLDTRLPFQS